MGIISDNIKTKTSSNRNSLSNVIIISGDGRNSGKTFFACQIIKHLSSQHNVIGVKISPHFHELSDGAIPLIKKDSFTILEEKTLSNKDSSLMLQAGAEKVFFVMAKDNNLEQAFHSILEQLEDKAVVIESGGLIHLVKPGLFFFLKKEESIRKKEYLKYNPLVLFNLDTENSFDPHRICFSKGEMKIIE